MKTIKLLWCKITSHLWEPDYTDSTTTKLKNSNLVFESANGWICNKCGSKKSNYK